ncbi:outer membrane lipoprotein carrier protein LolA [uncultured Desulfuromonas sp.]|uniref:LolA family protein n=1 Tax=uncultured Desulfuromonas sp. TaxID=181013 RepID=UPI002AAAF523|nr:outer membrane lipoprotein carrier protein LolA [uncultured Desulfuromonas sp.]
MRHLLLFIALTLIAAPTFAADLTADQLLDRVQQRFSDPHHAQAIHDFSAQFYQKAYIASLGRTRTGRGTISMRFDNQDPANSKTLLRWIYEVPSNQQIYSNGTTLWVYLPENNQVMISQLDDSLDQSNDPMLFLRNLGRLEQFFSAEVIGSPDDQSNTYRLELTPKKPSAYIQTLILSLPKWITEAQLPQALPLQRAAIVDQTGNQTEIEFRHVTLNQAPKTEQFVFKLPEKVEIIKASDLKLNLK